MARPTIIEDVLPVAAGQLPSLYALRDAAEVASYLRERPGTFADLAEIAKVVPEYFPDRAVTLAVLHDPEEPLVTLYVGIGARGDARNARTQLDLFDSEWWFPNSVDMDPDLCVSLDYS